MYTGLSKKTEVVELIYMKYIKPGKGGLKQ